MVDCFTGVPEQPQPGPVPAASCWHSGGLDHPFRGPLSRLTLPVSSSDDLAGIGTLPSVVLGSLTSNALAPYS